MRLAWLPQHHQPLHIDPEDLFWSDRILDLFLKEKIDKLTYLDWMEHRLDAVTRSMVEVFEQTH